MVSIKSVTKPATRAANKAGADSGGEKGRESTAGRMPECKRRLAWATASPGRPRRRGGCRRMNRSHDTVARVRAPGLSISPRLQTNGRGYAQRLLRHSRAKELPGKIQRVERSG